MLIVTGKTDPVLCEIMFEFYQCLRRSENFCLLLQNCKLNYINSMDMSLKADLESEGWHLSQEGIDLLCQGLKNPTVKDVIKKVGFNLP